MRPSLSLARVSPANPRLLRPRLRPQISISARYPAPRYNTARSSSSISSAVNGSTAPSWTTGRALLLAACAAAGAYAFAVSGGSGTEKQPRYGSVQDFEKVYLPSVSASSFII